MYIHLYTYIKNEYTYAVCVCVCVCVVYKIYISLKSTCVRHKINTLNYIMHSTTLHTIFCTYIHTYISEN